ncbi:MAG TPA: helix-turn-helix transcriptional regulator, partial [Ktedonobacterales bacterium]
REWRIKQGMTQQQVAFASGLGITTVRDIERERRVPSIVTARKLVRALGITLEQVRWPDER